VGAVRPSGREGWGESKARGLHAEHGAGRDACIIIKKKKKRKFLYSELSLLILYF
jgi:hypothetical protein